MWTQHIKLKQSVQVNTKAVWSPLLDRNFPREHINALQRRTEIQSAVQGHTSETSFPKLSEEYKIMSYSTYL